MTDVGGGMKVDMAALLAPEGGATSMQPGPGNGSDEAPNELDEIDEADLGEGGTNDEGSDTSAEEQGEADVADDDSEEETPDEGTKGNGDQGRRDASSKKSPANAVALHVQKELQRKFGPEATVRTGSISEMLEDLEELFNQPLHPEVARLQQHMQNGGNLENDLQGRTRNKQLLAMTDDKEFMKTIYKERFGKSDKRPNGLDDDRIVALVAKKDASGDLELEAFEEREKLTKAEADLEKENKQYSEGGPRFNPKDPEQLRGFHDTINKSVLTAAKTLRIPGVDLSKAESIADAQRLARHYFTPDEKGLTPYDRKMMGNENLVRGMLLLHYYENGVFDKALKEESNKGKLSVMKKLSVQPRPAGGGKSGKSGPDMGRLLAPETFTGSASRKN